LHEKNNMNPNSLISKAIKVAINAHQGQSRKDDKDTPFVVHPIGVALRISQYTSDPIIIAAALLHDTVEDTQLTNEEIKTEFGDEVAKITAELTEPSREVMSWKERKEYYLNHIGGASLAARMISCTDKIDNLESLIEAYDKQGTKMWDNFNSKNLWFYESVFEKLASHQDMQPLIENYKSTLAKAQLIIKPAV